jgi:histone deacetylase complex regulatory component SIN3
MLVLLAHDVIPHDHHHNTSKDQQVSIIHVHQNVDSAACKHHNHSGTHWNNQHETNNESCCILTHHRVQKEVKYQIFLKADVIQLDSENTQEVQKFWVHNYKLILEPLRFSPHRRGPPNSNLV